ncbi:hypothetical protein [Desulfovibrio inopinatus]|uniref:hypothetical protein n=1 Tax=Desulfovibrio inopinatus TaxID=102109 RepID=UPI00040C231D|nr:hypothetical protein [Desulfovibrio inopinatus]
MEKRDHRRQSHRHMRGSTLLYGIVLLVAVGALGAALSNTSSRSSFGQLRENQRAQAFYLAQSGINFARTVGGTKLSSLSASGSLAITVGTGKDIALDFTMPTGSTDYLLDSIGTINNGTNGESNFKFSSIPLSAAGLEDDVSGGGPTNDKYDYALFSTKGNTDIGNKAQITGSVYAHNVNCQHCQSDHNNEDGGKFIVTGNIVAMNNVRISSNSTVGGSICVGNNLFTKSGVSIGGDLYAQRNIVIEDSNSEIGGSIFAKRNVYLGQNCIVKGDVHAGGYVFLRDDAKVYGNIYSGNYVKTDKSDSVVGQDGNGLGDINAASYVDLKFGAIIYGNIIAGGYVNTDGTNNPPIVHGDITAGRSIDCYSDNTVVDCSKYVGGDCFPDVHNPPIVAPTAPEPCETKDAPSLNEDFNTGNISITINGYLEEKVIFPGEYASLQSSWNENSVYMSAGTYTFSSIDLGGNTNFYYDLSDGDILVFVDGNIIKNGPLNIYIKTDSLPYTNIKDLSGDDIQYASQVHFEGKTFQTQNGNNSDWFGTILCEGKLEFGSKDYLIGAYFTQSGPVKMNTEFTVIYVLSNYAKEHWY